MNSKYLLTVLITFLFTQEMKAQEYDEFGSEYPYYQPTLRDTVVIRDTVRIHLSKLDTILKHFDLSFDDFANTFKGYIKKHRDSLSYRTEENIYLNYLLPLYLEKNKTKRYFIKAYVKNAVGDSKIDFVEMPISSKLEPLSFDVMLIIEGEKNTDDFLKSPNVQATTVYKVLKDIQKIKTKNKIQIGLNICFPDFTFAEKRDMAQFVKSVSLVIDSTRIKGLRGIPLYLTFSKENKEKNKDYLTGLYSMVDSVFVINRTSHSMQFDVVPKEDEGGFLQIQNQLHFARFHMDRDFPKTDPEELMLQDVKNIMNADYSHNWEKYFFYMLGMLFFMLIATLCYFFIPAISNFVHNNAMYVFALGLLLVLELYLLFMSMMEGMSEISIFSFQNNDKILFLPLMLMVVIPIIKRVIRTQEIP